MYKVGTVVTFKKADTTQRNGNGHFNVALVPGDKAIIRSVTPGDGIMELLSEDAQRRTGMVYQRWTREEQLKLNWYAGRILNE